MKRCPRCGTVVAEGTDTCGVCGSDLSNVTDETFEVSVAAEEKIDAVEERIEDQRERELFLSRARRRYYYRISCGIGSAVCWAVVILGLTIGPPIPFLPRTIIVTLFTALISLAIVLAGFAYWGLLPFGFRFRSPPP